MAFIALVIHFDQYQTTMDAEQSKAHKKSTKKTSNDLLKCQRPTFELKRNEDGKVQAIISKLMSQQKQKPQIGFLPRSHLFDQLNSFMPILKQSNQQLMAQEIKPEQRIDAKLEELEDSSSSDSEEEVEKMEDENKMEAQKPSTEVLESCDEFEFNILTYPYADKENEGTSQEAKGETEQLSSDFKKVVEIVNTGEAAHEMQKMD